MRFKKFILGSKALGVIPLVLCAFFLHGQNLIQNPGFEDVNPQQNNRTLRLDTSLTVFPYVNHWRSPTFSPGGEIGNINNLQNFRLPKSGDYHLTLSINGGAFNTTRRNFAQSELTKPLESGCSYYFSIWFFPLHKDLVNPQTNDFYAVSNRLNAYFSADPISDTSGMSQNLPIRVDYSNLHFQNQNIIPQVEIPSDTFFTDTIYHNHTQIFQATGGEKYITLGNFYPQHLSPQKNIYTHHIDTPSVNAKSTYVSALFIDDLELIKVPNPTEIFTFSKDTTICQGDTVNLFANHPSANTYIWSTGDTTSAISVSKSGQYHVTAICTCGFEYKSTIQVNVIDSVVPPSIGDTILCNELQSITIPLPSGFTYRLNNHLISGNQLHIRHGGEYLLVGENQCQYFENEFFVEQMDCEPLVYIPNAFTPNGDGANDVFQISAENVTFFQVEIFNRWGQKIFHSESPNNAWNGLYNNAPAPQGLYIYKVQYTPLNHVTPIERTGKVTLLR
ncbi:MAG: gliding motility-associated C-terminal domain-containing protein [Cryomorphaceae bacterium]|nr:gliding motility-associated C-terminal domain-containing protein [Cryomorphaceae bacterium]